MESIRSGLSPFFSVAQIAEVFGISPQAVRYYHKEDLLIPQERHKNWEALLKHCEP